LDDGSATVHVKGRRGLRFGLSAQTSESDVWNGGRLGQLRCALDGPQKPDPLPLGPLRWIRGPTRSRRRW
jgi:hypothetical protein